MAHKHGRRRTWVQIRIRNPNPMPTLHCAKHVHIAQTRTWIPIPYFFTVQEFESVSIFESVPGNVNKSLPEETPAARRL